MVLLCAMGACSPGHNQRVLAGSVQKMEGQDWGPSCCERNLVMARDWDPSLHQVRDQDQVKDLGEGCLPLEGLASTSPWISCLLSEQAESN